MIGRLLIFAALGLLGALAVSWVERLTSTPGKYPGSLASPNNGASRVRLTFENGSFWTGERVEYAASMSVLEDGTIGYMGFTESKLAPRGSNTTVIDLQGRHVVPGFIDPHIHMIKGGLSLAMPNIASATSVSGLQAVIRDACGARGPNDWVYSIGWDEELWGGQEPSKQWLDEACADKPVVLERMCGHKIVVNSKAAKICGLTDSTPDPEGGKIYRDESGSFTGLLAENAIGLVTRHFPTKPNVEEKRKLVLSASDYLLSKGITMTHDMGNLPTNESEAFENLEHVYLSLAKEGKLPLRLFTFMPLPSWQRAADFASVHGFSESSGHLFWGGLKEFADGSIGSSTALFKEPYERTQDAPENHGVRNIATEELQELVEAADKAGLQVAIHAIGDQAVEEVLGIYERVSPRSAAKALRHRMEHSQHHGSDNVPGRLAKAGVHVVANPLHLLPDKRILQQKLGLKRAGPKRSYPLRSMLKAGVKQAFASDWPVVPSDPLLGIYAAAFRKQPDEAESFVPEERVTLKEALRASTIEGARLVGLEDKLGTLRVGKMADFVVLDADPLKVMQEGGFPTVLQTYVGGVCRFGCHSK